jgi:hypothetical protein
LPVPAVRVPLNTPDSFVEKVLSPPSDSVKIKIKTPDPFT